ncbi:MAG: YciI family protein [Pseudomonadota bacterium]
MATPNKDDILEASKGMLQKQLFAVFTWPSDDGMGPVMENLKEHLDFQVQLERDGIMFGAGPFWADDEHTWNGEGMVIIRADNLAHARQIAESDPMHSSGARKFMVRPWLLNEGTVTVKISYSDGRREVI